MIVLLLGTATGSAYLLLGMSVSTLVLLVLFYRPHIGSGVILSTIVAALTCAIIAIVISIH